MKKYKKPKDKKIKDNMLDGDIKIKYGKKKKKKEKK